MTTFRIAFDRPGAVVGRQPDDLEGAELWVLPNPSGLNAHYQLPDLIARFAELRAAVEAGGPSPGDVAEAGSEG